MEISEQEQPNGASKTDSGIAQDELRNFLNRNSSIISPVLLAFMLLYGFVFYYQWTFFYFPLVLLLIVCLIALYLLKNFSIGSNFIRRFAAENGYSYSVQGSPIGLDGFIFQQGEEQTVSDVVSGKFDGRDMSFFTFGYEDDSPHSKDRYYVSVFKFDIQSILPHIFLLNIQNGFVQPIVGILDGLENIDLEGNFNQYFKLRVEKGYEEEALEIFTPDIMQYFEDKGKTFGLEIFDNHLYVYKPRLLRDRSELDEFYNFTKFLVEKIKSVLESIKK
jgi:hypothetical protein